MTPIYFPFTYIPEPVSSALLSCFEKVAIYQPDRGRIPESLRCLEIKNRLDIRVPEAEKDDPLPELLKAHYAWADLHRGERPDIHRFGLSPAPASDETSTAWIQGEIRKADRLNTAPPPTGEKGESDRLLRARLFLAIAQEYDQQSESLSRDLHRIGTMGKDLFGDLAPDQEDAPLLAGLAPSGDVETAPPMSAERLGAWTRMYAHHAGRRVHDEAPFPPPPLLLITTDPEALDLLLGHGNIAEPVCRIQNIPLTGGEKELRDDAVRQQIEKTLRAAADGSALSSATVISFPGGGTAPAPTGTITLYRMMEDPVADLLTRQGRLSGPIEGPRSGGGRQYSLIGCMTTDLHA